MIDYRDASERKLNNIVTENENYAFDNVVVAVCELKARNLAVDDAVIAQFCDRHNLPGIDEAIDRFLAEHNVMSYLQYTDNAKWTQKLAKKDTTPPLRRTENVVNKIGQPQNAESHRVTETAPIVRCLFYLFIGIAIYYFLHTYIIAAAELGDGVPKVFKLLLAQWATVFIFGILTIVHFIRALVKWKRN